MKRRPWKEEITAAEKQYTEWNSRFKINSLVDYYEGFHWADKDSEHYVLNLFFAAIETKIPALIFQNPIFHFKPRAKSIALDPEMAFTSAQNREDVVNDWAMNPDNLLAESVEDAIYDSFFRYGVIELGYSASWVENNQIPRPEHKKPLSELDSIGPIKAAVVPRDEKLYAKHIPAANFRVSAPQYRNLAQHDWCGYFEYIRTADLKADSRLKNTDKLASGYSILTEMSTEENEAQTARAGFFSKIWTIYDLRAKKKFLVDDGSEEELLVKKFTHFPLVDIRFKKRPRANQYLPLPLCFNWISPQNEINDSREANRIHRRRFKRLYQTKPGSMDPDEKDKFAMLPDGTLIESNSPIEPIQNADLGSSAALAIQISKDDFNQVSATTSDLRGESDRTTATAAAITNNRAQIRENRERVVVANFLVKIGKLAALLVEDNFVNPLVVMPQQTSEEFLEDIQLQKDPKIINPLTAFGEDMDFETVIEIETLSPLANDEEKKKFIEFLSLLHQFPEFGMSPTLIRELAFRTGYRNERVIKEFQKMAQLQMIGMVEQGKQALAGGGGNMGNNTVKQMTPPTGEEVRNQLGGQGIPIQ